jgi:hypothetical protein
MTGEPSLTDEKVALEAVGEQIAYHYRVTHVLYV